MEINASNIFKKAIELDSRIIEDYLIEEQKISGYSPQVFFGHLKSYTNQISIKKLISYKNAIAEDLEEDYEKYKSELDKMILDKRSKEESLTRFSEKIVAAKLIAKNHEIFYEVINRILEQSISDSGTKSDFNNKFNSVPIELVVDHFKQLVETKNKSGENWMTEEDFEIFIRRSFGLEIDLPKPKIRIGITGKGKIIKLFYLFYSGSYQHGYSQNDQRGPIATLLKNAFDTNSFDKIDENRIENRASDWPWKPLKGRIDL
jgi:hypothetical protein|uniref:hypothetical protein n=2 Tax=Algoriphagus sp. TaxID=1872435 RepID=UPI004047CC1A